MTKKRITERDGSFDASNMLYVSIEDAIKYLSQFVGQNKYLAEDYAASYDRAGICLEYDRQETDEEYEWRIKREKRDAEYQRKYQQKEKERQNRLEQYLKLKKEFG